MKVIKRKSGITYFFITLTVFFLLYLFAQFLFNLIYLPLSEAINYVLEPNNLLKKLIASVIYALIMAFLIKRKENQLEK